MTVIKKYKVETNATLFVSFEKKKAKEKKNVSRTMALALTGPPATPPAAQSPYLR